MERKSHLNSNHQLGYSGSSVAKGCLVFFVCLMAGSSWFGVLCVCVCGVFCLFCFVFVCVFCFLVGLIFVCVFLMVFSSLDRLHLAAKALKP